MKKLVKNITIIILLLATVYAFLMFAAWRIDRINNNPNGYTDNGRAHSVKLFQ